MISGWRSWRRRDSIRLTSPILRLEERGFVTLGASLWRTPTTLALVGLPTINLWSFKTETDGACLSNLSILTLQNRSSPQWPEGLSLRAPSLQMANGISDAFGRTGRILTTPHPLSRSCEFRLPAEPQKQYCSSQLTAMFPAPGHHPTRVCWLNQAKTASR